MAKAIKSICLFLDWNTESRLQTFKKCSDLPHAYWWTKGPCRLIGTKEHVPTDRTTIWWQGKKRDQFAMKFKQTL